MNSEKVVYPIAAFSGASVLEVFKNENQLTSCRSLALKNGYYDGLKFVDSDGMLFTVSSAEKLGGIGPLWGFNIFFAQQIRVKVVISDDPVEIRLSELIKKVFEVFQNDEYLWDSTGRLDEIKNEIGKSVSCGEVIAILLRFTNSIE